MKKISIPVSIQPKKLSIQKSKDSRNKAMIAMQHNNLVGAKYSMTLQQKRIMIWLVFWNV